MRAKRRAIFLVSMLFIALLVAMFASAALSLAPASLTQGRQLGDRQVAERAIHTGMDYAVARLRASGGNWRGESVATLGSAATGLIVHEGDGQVEGWIQEGERWSRFRMRFNYLDGPGGADGLNQPADPWPEMRQLSFNNLASNSSRPLPACDSSGVVPATPTARFEVPAHCLVLAVEGSCGKVSLSGGVPTGFYFNPSQVEGEALLHINNPSNGAADAVIQAAGTLNFEVAADQKVDFRSRAAQTARLRSRGNMAVGADGQLTSPKGEVEGDWTGINYDDKNITIKPPDSKVAFYSIHKDQTPAVSGAHTVKGGVYEVDWDKTAEKPLVRYYDMNHQEYWDRRAAGTLVEALAGPPPAAFEVVDTHPGSKVDVQVHFGQDTLVTDSGTTKDLAIVPRQGAPTEREAATAAATGAPPYAAVPSAGVLSLANLLQTTLFSSAAINPTPGWNAATGDWFPSTTWSMSGSQGAMQNLESVPGPLVPIFQSIVAGGGSVPGFRFEGLGTGNPRLQIQDWDVNWDRTAADNYQYGSLQLAQTLMNQAQSNSSLAGVLTGYAGVPIEEVDDVELGGLSVQDLTIRLVNDATKGKKENGAVTLRSEGSLMLGGKLKGSGASLIAGGDISLRGNGVDMSANPENGLSVYAQGKVDINSYAYKLGRSRYEDVSIQGVIYSWGDVDIRTGGTDKTRWSTFSLTGAMVSYGKDPGDPGSSATPTKVSVMAKNARLVFDPDYLQNLLKTQVSLDTQFTIMAYHQR